MKKESPRSNWIWYLAGVLLCLTLVSVHLTSGLYARYCSTASGEDSARVARFNIEQTGKLTEHIEVDVYPGYSSQEYDIELKNGSEVAVAYTVSVERLTSNLPLTVTLTGGNAAGDGAGLVQASGTMAANSGDAAHYTLKIAWATTNNDDILSYEIDAIRVTVAAEQID